MAAKKLDIKTVLSKLDNNDYSYFDSLPSEDKNSLSPWVLMRYMSNASKYTELQLITVNELVNKHFSIINKHPTLMMKSLVSSGLGEKTYHKWLAPPKSKVSKNSLAEKVSLIYPEFNRTELELYISLNSVDYIMSELEQNGIDTNE